MDKIDYPASFNVASQVRAEAGIQQLSQTDIAKRSGLSLSSIRRKIFEHKRSISVDELAAIAGALKVPASELISRAEQREMC